MESKDCDNCCLQCSGHLVLKFGLIVEWVILFTNKPSSPQCIKSFRSIRKAIGPHCPSIVVLLGA